ncbi:MAG: ASPIC/UnbV domain-containing protein, partial [Gemmatimonadetes bacterium]|nr:ASPIC/UnbV domain-containing protein [Gemmatimonadota bacterium]
FADFDNDGDPDVCAEMGGAYPGDRFGDTLYENPGFGNRWLSVRLVGTGSNRSAIGARIKVKVDTPDGPRSIYKSVGSGGSFGANPLRQTIGLGDAVRIENLEVHWPSTGRTQLFPSVPMDTFIEVVEGKDRFTRLDLTSYRLGGS